MELISKSTFTEPVIIPTNRKISCKDQLYFATDKVQVIDHVGLT